MADHRLTCACGGAVRVPVGRAGGEVECPSCGRRMTVPTLRRLRESPSWDDADSHPAASGTAAHPALASVRGTARSPMGAARGRPAVSRGPWGLPESILFAAAVIAAASLLVASWLARPVTVAVDDALIRRAIAEAPTVDLYRAWQGLARSGVERVGTADEDRVQRITRARTRLAVAVGLLGGIASLAALGAAAAVLARRRLRSEAPGFPKAVVVSSSSEPSRAVPGSRT